MCIGFSTFQISLTRTFSNLADVISPAELHVFSKCCAPNQRMNTQGGNALIGMFQI